MSATHNNMVQRGLEAEQSKKRLLCHAVTLSLLCVMRHTAVASSGTVLHPAYDLIFDPLEEKVLADEYKLVSKDVDMLSEADRGVFDQLCASRATDGGEKGEAVQEALSAKLGVSDGSEMEEPKTHEDLLRALRESKRS